MKEAEGMEAELPPAVLLVGQIASHDNVVEAKASERNASNRRTHEGKEGRSSLYPAVASSLRARRSTLPTFVLGSASRNTTRRGIL